MHAELSNTSNCLQISSWNKLSHAPRVYKIEKKQPKSEKKKIISQKTYRYEI